MRTLAILALLSLGAPLGASCVTPAQYLGDVAQHAQQGVIIHRAPTDDAPGYQELLLRVVPHFKAADETPGALAWILTVPGKPLRYDVADKAALEAGPALHEKLYELARDQWDRRTRFKWPDALNWMREGRGSAGPANPALDVSPGIKVGPYDITEVKGTGAEAVTALNKYLRDNGFPARAPEDLQYFIDNDFTFLCVRITPPPGEEPLGHSLDLDPLVVGFETDRPYYPGKLSSRQGDFALDLTLITDTPLKNIPLEYTRIRLNAERRGYVHLLNLWSVRPLPDALKGALSDRAGAQPDMWFVNRIESHGFNETDEDGRPAVAGWEEDIFFEQGDLGETIAGFWYYGDTEVSAFEKFFREHALAIMLVMAFLLFGGLFVKTRINRKRLANST